jgi:hypothetical protein
MSGEDVIGEVSAENVRRQVEQITTHIPSRLAGSLSGSHMHPVAALVTVPAIAAGGGKVGYAHSTLPKMDS